MTKTGQGCLFFPSKDDQEKAQTVLEQDYKLSLSTKKKRSLLPKLKIMRIGSSYKKEDKEVLKLGLLEKNSYINAYHNDGHTFEVIIIDEKANYCVIKVSPEIRDAIMKRGTVYLDMESHEVKDQFHVIQCFRCQEHGHKKDDDVCKLKVSSHSVCLYCSGNHESKVCLHKKDSAKWNCSNCAKSSNPQYKNNCKGHTTTSNQCPFVIQQMKSLINRTEGLKVKNFFQ